MEEKIYGISNVLSPGKFMSYSCYLVEGRGKVIKVITDKNLGRRSVVNSSSTPPKIPSSNPVLSSPKYTKQRFIAQRFIKLKRDAYVVLLQPDLQMFLILRLTQVNAH